jgi:hypothetical protein
MVGRSSGTRIAPRTSGVAVEVCVGWIVPVGTGVSEGTLVAGREVNASVAVGWIVPRGATQELTRIPNTERIEMKISNFLM